MSFTQLKRAFSFDNNGKNMILPDPEASLSPEAVCKFYAHTYSILSIASVSGTERKDDVMMYTFTSTLGTKG
jgi:PRTRC genetic system protein C